MKLIYFLSLPLIFVIAGCTSTHESSQNQPQKKSEPGLKHKTNELVYDLNESTEIIINILKQGNLSEILAQEAQNSPDTINTLIKNFSPAEMAFEAEVLNFKDPVVVLFFDETDPEAQKIDSSFKELAFRFHNKAKFVMIESTKLFKLAEQALITVAPTLMLINNREEIGRIEKPEPALFDTELTSLLSKITLF